MSAIFNGSNASITLASSIVGTADLDYGVLICCWFKAATPGAVQSIFSATNNLTGGNLRSVQLDIDTSTKLRVRHRGSTANGDATTTNAWTQNTWTKGFAQLLAVNNRYAAWDNETPTQGTGSTGTGVNSIQVAIGKLHSGAGSQYFNGRIAELGVWTLTDQTQRDAIITDFKAGMRPSLCANSNKLVFYQPLKAGINEADSVGGTVSASNVTYDDSDHPVSYFQTAWAHGCNSIIAA